MENNITLKHILDRGFLQAYKEKQRDAYVLILPDGSDCLWGIPFKNFEEEGIKVLDSDIDKYFVMCSGHKDKAPMFIFTVFTNLEELDNYLSSL